VFAVDKNTGSLQHWWFDNGWKGPESWGGVLAVPADSSISTDIVRAVSAVNTAGRLDVFAVASDLTLQHWWTFKGGIARRPSTVAELVKILFGVIGDGGGLTSGGPVPPRQEMEVCLLVAEVAKNYVKGAQGKRIEAEAMRLMAQIAQRALR
jgi:hypothetical protein